MIFSQNRYLINDILLVLPFIDTDNRYLKKCRISANQYVIPGSSQDMQNNHADRITLQLGFKFVRVHRITLLITGWVIFQSFLTCSARILLCKTKIFSTIFTVWPMHVIIILKKTQFAFLIHMMAKGPFHLCTCIYIFP